ncbi:ChaN family lipoprotein [Tropicimonas isoalkanivorans]|uniref:Haem-binding uptake, Tiki superfamily, ChaN n=1 Tax=Tropicimonas isoalkanivorans TaxID=441112 RepID=A0A1I1JDG0_9RHOB|nr:ChaN family lipoprotein [Tropicimonas isoalkanivorans]SFC46171.1 Haem-binding uptake, Tiki superfamily, ChaN [Tropicimonas isoalkanivorans]
MRLPLITLAFAVGATTVPAAQIESIDQLDATDAQVFLLGEVHDNPAHHQNQAEAVAAIAPTALVFEMLTAEQADIANGLDRTDVNDMAEALDWAHGGWPDFTYYHPIFTAAPNAPIYGAAVPREDLSDAVREGAAAVFGSDAEQFALGPLPTDTLEERKAFQMEAHCNALPEDMLGGMVEAQRLRDAWFSKVALQALDETGGPVVVITGNGHARKDRGMPVALASAAPDVTVVSLGQFESPFEDPPEAVPHDVWLVTEPAEREDPCAVFQKG